MKQLILMRGCTRAGKSVLSRRLALTGLFEYIEMDAYKHQKYGKPWVCNPDVDFPAVGRLAKKLLRDGKRVVVEESMVDRTHAAAVARWAGFELDDPRIGYVWLDLSLDQALARKPGAPFPIELLRAQYARYESRWHAPKELLVHTAALSEAEALSLIFEYANGEG